jgi:hypothetical protein
MGVKTGGLAAGVGVFEAWINVWTAIREYPVSNTLF